MRHKKQMRPDRIVKPHSIGNQHDEAIYHSLRPLDMVAATMEQKWGIDRLVSLVSPATAQRFGIAKAKLDAAIDENDMDAVAAKAAVLMRGWKALEDEALANKAEPLQPKPWRIESGQGDVFMICQTLDEAKAVTQEAGCNVYSGYEIANILTWFEKQSSVSGEVKKLFPQATIERIRSMDDDIPF